MRLALRHCSGGKDQLWYVLTHVFRNCQTHPPKMQGLDMLSGFAVKRPKAKALCGTWGCILQDCHSGLHKCAISSQRRSSQTRVPAERNDAIAAAQSLVQYSLSRITPDVNADSLQQIVIRVQANGVTFVQPGLLPSLRVRRWWTTKETGIGRGHWYSGTITNISDDNASVFIRYDDGDMQWELLSECEFL